MIVNENKKKLWSLLMHGYIQNCENSNLTVINICQKTMGFMIMHYFSYYQLDTCLNKWCKGGMGFSEG